MAVRSIREFIQLESSAGIVLFIAAALAMALANSPLKQFYFDFFNWSLGMHMVLWINDGLMTIFFLLIGLEIKREICVGELSTIAKSILPVLAAIGGMIAPALIYLIVNRNHPFNLQGWAIPTATDIAFSLAILSLLGSRIPTSLKIFLTALAIFDDIGAIVIIAIFYTQQIQFLFLFLSLLLIFILFLLNQRGVTHLTSYIIVGILLWLCVFKSGVHATLAGIALAFAIPLRDKKNPGHFPLRKLEHQLHPWVSFGILPLFAFANAGVSFQKVNSFFEPVSLGIALGLFLGKQLGIFAMVFAATKSGIAKLPHAVSYLGIYGISLIAGVGFTMSLFIGTLAFGTLGDYPMQVRYGVLIGSLSSGVLGYMMLRGVYNKKI